MAGDDLTAREAGNVPGWLRWMPGLRTLLHYKPAWLAHDLVAGLVLATMLVPVGVAYAVASGLPGICGLYATIVPLLVYAVYGTVALHHGLGHLLSGMRDLTEAQHTFDLCNFIMRSSPGLAS